MQGQLENVKTGPAARQRKKYGYGGEGTEHRQLKEWCANNPQGLGIQGVISIPGRTEYPPCGDNTSDSVDVVFEMPGGRYAVIEVETSNPQPGAYQALKYKTLLCADRGYPIDSDKVQAILVAWQIPQEVRSFCSTYGIDCHEKRV